MSRILQELLRWGSGKLKPAQVAHEVFSTVQVNVFLRVGQVEFTFTKIDRGMCQMSTLRRRNVLTDPPCNTARICMEPCRRAVRMCIRLCTVRMASCATWRTIHGTLQWCYRDLVTDPSFLVLYEVTRHVPFGRSVGVTRWPCIPLQ